MRLRVTGCGAAGGEAEAPSSLWAGMVAVAAAAAAGGREAEGVPPSPCVSELSSALSRLGFNVERVSSTKLVVEAGGEPRGGSVVLRCGLLAAALAAPLAAATLPPGVRLVFRTGSDWLRGANVKGIVEAAVAAGGRAWPGEGPVLLVVEGGLARPPRTARLYMPWGASLVGLLLGLAARREGDAVVKIHGRLRVPGLVEEAARLLAQAGTTIRIEEGAARPPRLQERLSVKAGASPYTAMLAALPLLSCKGDWEAQLAGLGTELLGDTARLLRGIGLDAEPRGEALRLAPGEPRSMLHDAGDHPDHAAAALLHAGMVPGTLVTGVEALSLEGYLYTSLLKQGMLAKRGEALEALPWEPPARRSCAGDPVTSCLYVLGSMLRRKGGLLEDAWLVEARFPGVAAVWTQLCDCVEAIR